MSVLRWVGRAPVVRQVDTVQITADDASTTYSVTIGGVTVEVPGAGTGVNATAAALQAALAASVHPYFEAVTWTVNTATVTGTGGALGEPFVLAAAVTGGTGTLTHTAEVVAAESPNHFDVAANWSGGAVPTTADEILFDKGGVPLLWAIDQNTLSVDVVRTYLGYTGWIGLNAWGFLAGGAEVVGVPEYRETHLKVAADLVEIGRDAGGGGAGQGRVNIHNGDTGTPYCHVIRTAAAPKDAGQLAVDYVANDAQAVLVVTEAPGGVGVGARKPGTTGTLSEITHAASPGSSSKLVVADGITVTNVRSNGGATVLAAASTITTLRVSAGICHTVGEEWSISTAHVYGGTLALGHFHSSAAAGVINVYSGGVLDCNRTYRARLVNTVNVYPGGRYRTDSHTVIATALDLNPQGEPVDITVAKVA